MGYFIGFSPLGWGILPWDAFLSKHCNFNLWLVAGVLIACVAIGFLAGWFIRRAPKQTP
jgi:hypothetical protein